ncbi:MULTISPECIES: sugar kinase [Pseudomonas]|uniref:Sugar kinase n=1 Tax=Pseudomonas petroselini TaxID=2899822 RepID=A0ABS8R3R9_9PSED|nr:MULTISPECIES: sugar kinase [Pseudomonas]MCD7042571.1 sugar kinase [Pseudomonas petroselini]MCD7048821.1 sugar kinase [Pseudomonas petroselini]MCD7067643.1 sugar kinase [Pseudomonas petroselini]MCD7078843.1 sugar kinase [Pseudomonas petroselini]MCM2379673.1 sugar kinase [Pseudomonas marginalis]
MNVIPRQRPQNMSPRPLKVALVGECMIEIRGESVSGFSQTFGGDTLNAAVYLCRLTPSVRIVTDYVTAIGADSFSDAMRQLWRDEGVGDQHVRVIEDALPGLYFIQTDTQGERRFLYWRGEAAARSMFDGPEADAVLHALSDYDYIYLSGISLAILTASGRERLMRALCLARESGTRIVFDNNYRPHLWPDAQAARQAYGDMLRLTDLALITWEDDAALFGYADVEALFHTYADFGVGEVAVKRGMASCLIQCASGRVEVPADQVQHVVDTTAAGDSFSAAYLACRLQGGDPQLAARWGHRLAAQVIQHRGALIPSAAMPSLQMPSFSSVAEA